MIYHYFPSEASENSPDQLYDLARDPFEQTNLAGSRPTDLKRMMQSLATALEKHGAVYPVDPASRAPLKPKLP